jgi:hypothetical protein
MKKILLIALIALSLGAGYFYYQQTILSRSSSSTLTPKFNLTQAPLDVDSLKQVLGTATSAVLDTSNAVINQVTDGEGEPIINEALETIQKEISEIPQEQYDKIKYEFCQGVIQEYEEQE